MSNPSTYKNISVILFCMGWMQMKESRKWINRMIQAIVILIIAFLTGMMTYHVTMLDDLMVVKNRHSQLNKESQRLYKLALLFEFEDALYDKVEKMHQDLLNTQFTIKNKDYIAYKNELAFLSENWDGFKKSLSKYLENNLSHTEFLVYSEYYYDYTNRLENAFDQYYHSIALNMNRYVYSLVFFVGLLVIFYGYLLFTKMKLIHHNDELELMSYIDETTGLFNRRKCNEMIHNGFDFTHYPLYGCVMFDLNNLKYVNDHFGHQYGDILIRQFSSILKHKIGQDIFIGRYGGDEFLMITRHYSEMELMEISEAIQKEVDQFNQSQTKVQIQFAWGYSMATCELNRTMQEVIELADMDMYRCKRNMKKEILL